ncbi:hypothetical protein HF086_000378 [Spodoptera exigua]|uniref:Uncharacterized protein n=1 Tax=Spodoptera exigua TaxID=7107 RepID=A0A922SDL2_SPOEX|nr:hypothetical protein HF086_000378 [Spodoptera exigua]
MKNKSLDENDGTLQIIDSSQLCEFNNQIVGYIAGFVVRILRKQIKCNACIDSLIARGRLDFHKLMSIIKDKGGLVYASRDVYDICKKTETVFRQNVKQDFVMTSSNYSKIIITVLKNFVGGISYFAVETAHVCGVLHQIQLTGSKNIKSGFKATGISPFNPREVLKRIPEYHEDLGSYEIDEALLDYLKQIRQPNPINVRRHKKVVTEPGKSVTVNDFLRQESNATKSSVPGVRKTKITQPIKQDIKNVAIVTNWSTMVQMTV